MSTVRRRFIERMWRKARRLRRWSEACIALGFVPHYLWMDHEGSVP